MTGDVHILAGPPGAGKTTVADLLAVGAATPTVHLATDVFFRAIRAGYVLPYLPEAEQQNEVVIEAVVTAVTVYTRGGYDVVVEGIIGPWFLPAFRALPRTVSYVVLRPDLETAVERAQERAGRELKDIDPITGLYHAFTRLGDLEPHAIDTTGLGPEQTATEVRRLIAAGAHRLS